MSATAGALNFTLGLQANQFLNQLGVASGKLLAFTGVASAIHTAFDKMWFAIEKGGNLKDLAAAASLSVKDLYRLQRGFEDVGASAESVPAIINKLRRTLAGGEQNGLLASMGLDPALTANMDPADQFARIASAMSKLNVNARSQAATALFGREGAQTIQQIANSGSDFAEAMQRAVKDADIWQKVSGAFDAISDKVKEVEAHITTMWAELAGGLIQAFREGHLAETIFETFSLAFQALGAALPNILAAGLVSVGQGLLDALRVPVAFLQTAFDASVQGWMALFSKIPGLRDAMGIPANFKTESWSALYNRNKENGYQLFPGMDNGAGGFVSQQMTKAAEAARPFLEKIGVTFEGLLNRLGDGRAGSLAGEGGGGAASRSGMFRYEATALEKMGAVLHGVGPVTRDDSRAVASNTRELVRLGKETVKLLGEKGPGIDFTNQ